MMMMLVIKRILVVVVVADVFDVNGFWQQGFSRIDSLVLVIQGLVARGDSCVGLVAHDDDDDDDDDE